MTKSTVEDVLFRLIDHTLHPQTVEGFQAEQRLEDHVADPARFFVD